MRKVRAMPATCTPVIAMALIVLAGVMKATAGEQQVCREGSCPLAKDALMLQLTVAGLDSANRTLDFNTASTSTAYAAQLQSKIVAARASEKPAAVELDSLIKKFIAQQSDSEDKCSAQLLEAKHHFNHLHVTINDLAAEVKTTQTTIPVQQFALETKQEEEKTVQEWQANALKKCETEREERRKMLRTLKEELEELQQIADPDVTMDLKARSLSTGASLLEVNATTESGPGSFSGVQSLVLLTKTAAAALMECVKAPATSSAELLATAGVIENPTRSPDEKCRTQKDVLEKTLTKTYVELTRLIAENEELVKSTSCEDAVRQEFKAKAAPIQKAASVIVANLEETNRKLSELRPRLEDANNAEKRLRSQIATLTKTCSSLPETVSDLDKIRDVIAVMGKCPGLEKAKFNIPIWIEEWVMIRQTIDESDEALDARLDEACAKQISGRKETKGRSWPVRAAEVGEIMEVSVQGMPKTNTAEAAVIGACPLCAGEEDVKSGVKHTAGHARICWDSESAFSEKAMRKDCSTGLRAVLCVYDRGDIRKQTREHLQSSTTRLENPGTTDDDRADIRKQTREQLQSSKTRSENPDTIKEDRNDRTTQDFSSGHSVAASENGNHDKQEPARMAPTTAASSTTPMATTTEATTSRPLTQEEQEDKWSTELAKSSLDHADAEQALCTSWGDPHFTAFAGFKTNSGGKGKILWLVKTDDLWIQLRSNYGGSLLELAVKQGEDTVIITPFDRHFKQVLLRGIWIQKTRRMLQKPVLSINGKLLEWGPFVRQGMMMTKDKVPHGSMWNKHKIGNHLKNGMDIWTLKLMDGVQVHFTLPSHGYVMVLLQMPLEQGVKVGGFCGDKACDRTPGGACTVSLEDSLFGEWTVVEKARKWYDYPSLLDTQGAKVLPSLDTGDFDSVKIPHECPEQERAKAEEMCADIPEKDVRADCVFDACVSHDAAAAEEDAYGFEELEEADGKGIPVLDGIGKCVDSEDRNYSTFNTLGLTTKEQCAHALSTVALVEGVHGAQLQEGSSCQIITDAGVDLASSGMKGSTTEGEGNGMVSGASGEEGWICWKVNNA